MPSVTPLAFDAWGAEMMRIQTEMLPAEDFSRQESDAVFTSRVVRQPTHPAISLGMHADVSCRFARSNCSESVRQGPETSGAGEYPDAGRLSNLQRLSL